MMPPSPSLAPVPSPYLRSIIPFTPLPLPALFPSSPFPLSPPFPYLSSPPLSLFSSPLFLFLISVGEPLGLVWSAKWINGGASGRVVSTGYNGKIKLWDANTRGELTTYTQPRGENYGIWDMDVQPNTNNAFIVGQYGMLRGLDLETSQFFWDTTLSKCHIWNLCCYWPQNLIVTSSQDSSVRLWDTRQPTTVGGFRPDTGRDGGDGGESAKMDYQPFGVFRAAQQLTHLSCYEGRDNILIGGNSEGVISFWDIRSTKKKLLEFNSTNWYPECHFWSEPLTLQNSSTRAMKIDGTKMLLSDQNSNVCLYFLEDILTKNLTKPTPSFVIPQCAANRMAITDSMAILGLRDGGLTVLDFKQEEHFSETLEKIGKNFLQIIETTTPTTTEEDPSCLLM
eukprot:TRINITY_DN2676_c0_g1_i3.p1 TRINITY_DN2676_c0_g1~~TRINITY_DN2676_c0_g1_i3.p1  ORF type:complete len:395 (-),score=89.28 TRINITY_DN2676_c0_g1_i3:246-1430(-)